MTFGDLMDKWKAEIIEEKEAESRQILQETIEQVTKQITEEKNKEIEYYKKLYEDAIKLHNE